MTKEELRQQLAAAADAFEGEVVRYAAVPAPERKPWKRRPSLLDEAYLQALADAEAAQAKEH